MQYKHLHNIHSPADLKRLSMVEMQEYAHELRGFITQTTLKNGGHLAPSLGAVEIAIALHTVLDCPTDKILWDVGHQAYAHKMITGRAEGFNHLRTDDGVSGFIKPSESPYDAFVSGHASNALGAAIGFVRAAKLQNMPSKVAAVVGDGALTGGMAFEALNDIGDSGENITIILNDNEMSISENVGGMSRYFSRLRISRNYLKFKNRLKRVVTAIPFAGGVFFKALDKTKRAFGRVLGIHKFFEQMGIRYYGPYDGNDLPSLVKVLRQAHAMKGPVLLHLITQKGRGFKDAEENPSSYHGLAPAGPGVGEQSFSSIAGKSLCALAKENAKICTITAAMADGTGLSEFSKKFPNRFFDVGIAEQHAVTLAAGLAAGGLKPYVCLYSSFLQRAYDQVMHDVCIMNLPVTFLVDRAGVIGADGVTHQGVYDIAYLSNIPNLTILAPKDGEELKEMLELSVDYNAPLAIRYPKSFTKNYGFCTKVETGKWELFPFVEGMGKAVGAANVLSDIYILAAGNRMLELACQTTGAQIVNARSVKPLDTDFLEKLANGDAGVTLITLEDHMLTGGFGASVTQYLNQQGYIINGKVNVINLGLKDAFIHTHSINKAFELNDLTVEHLQGVIDKVTKLPL